MYKTTYNKYKRCIYANCNADYITQGVKSILFTFKSDNWFFVNLPMKLAYGNY